MKRILSLAACVAIASSVSVVADLRSAVATPTPSLTEILARMGDYVRDFEQRFNEIGHSRRTHRVRSEILELPSLRDVGAHSPLMGGSEDRRKRRALID